MNINLGKSLKEIIGEGGDPVSHRTRLCLEVDKHPTTSIIRNNLYSPLHDIFVARLTMQLRFHFYVENY